MWSLRRGLPVKNKPGVFLAFSNLLRGGASQATSESILKKIDFNPLQEALGSEQSRMVALSDVVGGCTKAIAVGMKTRPDQFKQGEKITFAVTGGGLGMVNADTKRDTVNIKMSESGTVLDGTRDKQALELSRASVTALTTNFMKALQASPFGRLSKLNWRFKKGLNPAKLPGIIVTRHDEALKVLPYLSEKRHAKAAAVAIRGLEYGLSYEGDGTTVAILAGPVVKGVKSYLEKHPEPFRKEIDAHDSEFPHQKERPVLEKILMHRLYSQLSFAKRLFMKDHLDVITDIDIADNTVGAKYVLKGEPEAHPYHFNIPLSAFNEE